MPAQSHFDRFLQPIFASRFLTVSALIHLIVIILFGSKVLSSRHAEAPEFQATNDSEVSTDVAPAPPQTADATLPPAPVLAPPPLPGSFTAPVNLAALTSINTGDSTFTMPLPAIAPPVISNALSPETQQISSGAAVSLPAVMDARLGGERDAAAEKYGAKPGAGEGVLRALRWLQAQQQTGGAWGTKQSIDGLTGLALLCFLGHGETPQSSHEFGVVVANAIGVLVAEGAAHEGRFTSRNDFRGAQAPYQHAVCTCALCEAYGMTHDERLGPLISQAVDYIVKAQRPDGGWTAAYDTTPDVTGKPPKSETSVSAWQIQALKAASLTGIQGIDAAVEPALNLAMKNIDRVYNATDGAFGDHSPDDRNYRFTGAAVLSKLLVLGRPDREVRQGLKYIESKDISYDAKDCDLYVWYYNTQACFEAQGQAWNWWRERFQDQLTGKQAADGSWPVTGGRDTVMFGNMTQGDGPLYRTSLCSLMLEVFYRYLPTGQAGASGGVEGL